LEVFSHSVAKIHFLAFAENVLTRQLLSQARWHTGLLGCKSSGK